MASDHLIFGLAIGAGIALVAWIVALEVRLRRLQGALFQQQQKVKDDEIKNAIHAMPDSALDATIAAHIGKRSGEPKL